MGPVILRVTNLNESSLRMYDPKLFEGVRDADHFYAMFATATRHALVDHQRHRKAKKRGGGFNRLPLDVVLNGFHEEGIDIVELNDELEKLRNIHPRYADAIELKYFAGMTVPEIAKQLNVSISTVEADLRFARAWLGRDKS